MTRSDVAWRGALVLGGVLLVLLGAGLLSTRAFDFRLQMPAAQAPSRSDFLVVGFRALVPSVIYALIALGLFMGAQFLARQVLGLVPRIPGVGDWTETRATSISRWWRRTTRRARARTISDLFFLGSIVVSLLFLSFFTDLFFAIVGYGEDAFACAARSLHRAYPVAMGVLVAGLGLAWHGVFRWLGGGAASDRRVRLVRAASLGWILMLVLLTAVPWRLLWDAAAERIRVGAERAYLLRETPTEYVVFEPRRHAARSIAKQGSEEIDRLGTIGYVFEEAQVFESGERECASVTG